MYFVIFKKKKDKDYRLFTNTIFSEEETAKEFARKSKKRGQEFKVVEYTQENLDDYWYTKQIIRYVNIIIINNPKDIIYILIP